MMLPLLLMVLFLFGLLAACVRDPSGVLPRAIGGTGILLAICIAAIIAQQVWLAPTNAQWLLSFKLPWISSWNINFHLAVDGIAFWLMLATLLMTACAFFVARPAEHAGSYYAAILWASAGLIGLFFSADVFLFFIFWEVALLPIYWMLVVHGNSERVTATLRFVVFTQLSGLILLVTTLGLVYANFTTSGVLTFDYHSLIHHKIAQPVQMLLLLGFIVAFLIKLPSFGFHAWMPSVFTEAPAPILLVGILVKSAVFGLMRFTWPLFLESSKMVAPFLMILGVVSVIYGAIVAFSQSEPRRFLAYSTLSHAGILLIGVFCENRAAYVGVFILLLTQALSTGGALMVIERLFLTNPRTELTTLGGLWEKWPRFSSVLLMFLLAGFGFPIFGTFVGEWSVLMGTFLEQPVICVLTLVGVVLSAVYSLKFFQRLCLGTQNDRSNALLARDLSTKELSLYGALVLMLLGIGLYPTFVLKHLNPPFLVTATDEVRDTSLASKVVP